jgi:hypothetical protein
MEHNINWQRKFISWTRNKKSFYTTLAVIIVLLAVVVILFFNWQGQQAAKKEAILQAQKISQAAEAAKKSVTWSLQSFFLTAPAGARAAFKVASDIEGFWRINDTSGVDKKMTILYVKNPDYAQPLLYIRYDNKTDFKLKEGETEMKTNSAKYSYAYYFYPVDSYPGADKAEFTSMQNDFKNSLATFSVF